MLVAAFSGNIPCPPSKLNYTDASQALALWEILPCAPLSDMLAY